MNPANRYLAIRSDGLSFIACLHHAAAQRDLVENFDRLYGCNLSQKGAPIELMIDEASGRMDYDLRQFVDFVWEFVFMRCPEIDGPAS